LTSAALVHTQLPEKLDTPELTPELVGDKGIQEPACRRADWSSQWRARPRLECRKRLEDAWVHLRRPEGPAMTPCTYSAAMPGVETRRFPEWATTETTDIKTGHQPRQGKGLQLKGN
jgi:hypothetical protein